MKARSIDIIKVNRDDFSQLRNQFDNEVFRFFPNIKNPGFHHSLISLYEIVEQGVIKGILFTTKSEFIEFGSLEMSIIVFPNYQRCGIGRVAIEKISTIEKDYYFRVRKDNISSMSLFNKSESLKCALLEPYNCYFFN